VDHSRAGTSGIDDWVPLSTHRLPRRSTGGGHRGRCCGVESSSCGVSPYAGASRDGAGMRVVFVVGNAHRARVAPMGGGTLGGLGAGGVDLPRECGRCLARPVVSVVLLLGEQWGLDVGTTDLSSFVYAITSTGGGIYG